jgi:uncharacterized protein YggE
MLDPVAGLRRWLLCLAVMLLMTSMGQAQSPKVVAQPNTVFVNADGHYEAAPDTALLQFNIAAQEDSAQAAYDRASRAAQQVRDILRSNGIDPKAAEIGFFSLAPVYDYRQPKRKLLGYRASSGVTLKLKDFSKLAGVVEQLAAIDITENNSLSYTLEDMDAAKLRAVENAFAHARAEASALAVAGGRTLGELSYGTVDTTGIVPVVGPRPMAMRANAATETPPAPTAEFTPHRITVNARVSAVFALK